MNRDKGEWTDALRRTLSQAEEPLPEGGWRRLEDDLGAPAPQMPRATSYKIWMRFAAAAAVVLVCVSVGVRIIRNDRNVLKRVVMVQGATVSEQIADAEESTSSASVDITALPEAISSAVRSVISPIGEVDVVASLTSQRHNAARSQFSANAGLTEEPMLSDAGRAATPGEETASRSLNVSRESSRDREREEGGRSGDGSARGEQIAQTTAASVDIAEDQQLAQTIVASVDVAEGQQIAPPTGAPPETVENLHAGGGSGGQTPSSTRYRTADYDGLFADAQPRRRRAGGSFGVAAGGVVTAADGNALTHSQSLLLLDNDGVASLQHAYSEYTYKHRQPLSFGMTFRKEFGYGLSLESGLVYTLLRSDVTVPGALRDVRQRLHLLGIPLRMNWEFLRVGGFSLYAGLGGRAEMCVSARFGDESISERQVLWSVFGAVGAQYKFGKRVGLYFEPEVSHYLTHTTLRTPYTDSALSLNLQLGLRFNY